MIATELNDPQDLAVDSSNAYWTDKPHSGAGSVMKVALSAASRRRW